MSYVSPSMIAAHAEKHLITVLRALSAAGITPEKLRGVRGGRIKLAKANAFLAKQWPEVPAMGEAA